MKNSKILCLLVGSIIVTVIGGCGGGSDPGKNNTTPTPTIAGATPIPTILIPTSTPTSIITPTPVSSPTPTSRATPIITPSPASSSTPTPTPYGFSCNFDSYSVANPWNLPSGWWSNTGSAWAIVNPGYSGNGAKYVGNAVTFLTCPYNNTIGGNNYTVTVKLRLTMAIAGNLGICARFDNSTTSCYGLILSDVIGQSKTCLAITKFNNWTDYQMANQIFINSYLNTGTYYTLTLTVSGTNPVQINGSVTDGVNSQTVSFTDDGGSYGSPHTSGKVGVYVYCNGSVNVPVIFDDFKVTVP